jgi:hypothetical protein
MIELTSIYGVKSDVHRTRYLAVNTDQFVWRRKLSPLLAIETISWSMPAMQITFHCASPKCEASSPLMYL